MNRIAMKAMESYKDEDMPMSMSKDDYSADLESEVKAFMSAVKAGDVKAAARAFKEAHMICAGK